MTNCPYSTMCLKTISTLHLQNGQKQETVTRGCAQQKNTTQVTLIFTEKYINEVHNSYNLNISGISQPTVGARASSARSLQGRMFRSAIQQLGGIY